MAVPSGPPPMPVPWQPPRPNESKTVVVIVAVVVAVILAMVVMAAVLYVMVSGLLAGRGGPEPPLGLLGPNPCGTGCTELRVREGTDPQPLTVYDVTLALNGTVLFDGPLAPGVLYDDMALTLSFVDVEQREVLDSGDVFRVQNTGSSRTCDLTLEWSTQFSSGSTGANWVC